MLIRWQGWGVARRFFLIFLAYTLNLLIDLVGPDKCESYGLLLFWPFSSKRFESGVPFLLVVHHVVCTEASTSECLWTLAD